MSWSVRAVGRAKAVADKVSKEIAGIKCAEPEESIKNAVGAIVATTLAAFPDDSAVEIDLSGSQWKDGDKGTMNDLNVKVRPIYGFVG
jgi:hypothetical protein